MTVCHKMRKSVLSLHSTIYCAQISSVEPFSDRTEDHDTIKQAWIEVCTGRNVQVELEEDIYKLVSVSSYFLFSLQ